MEIVVFHKLVSTAMVKHDHHIHSNHGNLGGLAIAVPGTLKGLVHAYKKYGNLSWSNLVQPAIDIAEKGFNVPRTLATAIEADKRYILDKENFPGLKYVCFVCVSVCICLRACMLRIFPVYNFISCSIKRK